MMTWSACVYSSTDGVCIVAKAALEQVPLVLLVPPQLESENAPCLVAPNNISNIKVKAPLCVGDLIRVVVAVNGPDPGHNNQSVQNASTSEGSPSSSLRLTKARS